MKKELLAATAAAFLCSTLAIAAPVPSSVSGISATDPGDVVQVRAKRKHRKSTKRSRRTNENTQDDMSGGAGAGAGATQPGTTPGGAPGAAPGTAPAQSR